MSALPLPPASTLRRPPRLPSAAAAILLGFLVFESLNFTGFCYRDMRSARTATPALRFSARCGTVHAELADDVAAATRMEE